VLRGDSYRLKARARRCCRAMIDAAGAQHWTGDNCSVLDGIDRAGHSCDHFEYSLCGNARPCWPGSQVKGVVHAWRAEDVGGPGRDRRATRSRSHMKSLVASSRRARSVRHRSLCPLQLSDEDGVGNESSGAQAICLVPECETLRALAATSVPLRRLCDGAPKQCLPLVSIAAGLLRRWLRTTWPDIKAPLK
jgi:hypothetical protein